MATHFESLNEQVPTVSEPRSERGPTRTLHRSSVECPMHDMGGAPKVFAIAAVPAAIDSSIVVRGWSGVFALSAGGSET
jgi:hypothetical protein